MWCSGCPGWFTPLHPCVLVSELIPNEPHEVCLTERGDAMPRRNTAKEKQHFLKVPPVYLTVD